MSKFLGTTLAIAMTAAIGLSAVTPATAAGDGCVQTRDGVALSGNGNLVRGGVGPCN